MIYRRILTNFRQKLILINKLCLLLLDGWTEHFVFRCKVTNNCVKELVGFINVFQIYPNMFRQVVTIFRVSYVP
jgi:hypothetical protein